MATFKFKGMVNAFQQKLIGGMLAKGYEQEFAERIFKQLEGFGSYGFPESHAASFALLVYVSSWMKCHHPDVFACGLLNSLPMGFYAPAQIVTDARNHGVTVRPIDVNHSVWYNTLEELDGNYRALRLGFNNINGFREADADTLVARRGRGYADIAAVWNAGVSQAALERLAEGDAFRSINLDRRKALWEVTAPADKPATLFMAKPNEAIIEAPVELPTMTLGEHVINDYSAMRLSLKAHPVVFLRDTLTQKKIVRSRDLKFLKDGQRVKVAGLVLSRQRPGTAGGVCFVTLEDEVGTFNLVVFENVFQKYRKALLWSKLLMAEGTVQIEGIVIHVIVKSMDDLTPSLQKALTSSDENMPLLTLARGDEGGRISNGEAEALPKARNFR